MSILPHRDKGRSSILQRQTTRITKLLIKLILAYKTLLYIFQNIYLNRCAAKYRCKMVNFLLLVLSTYHLRLVTIPLMFHQTLCY